MGAPSQINARMAKSYADYLVALNSEATSTKPDSCATCDLVAFTSIKEATTDLDKLCCAACLQANLKRLHYTLNIAEYNKNPFFLAYKSEGRKGLLVDGKPLTEEDIANTERQLQNIRITTPVGNNCVRY